LRPKRGGGENATLQLENNDDVIVALRPPQRRAVQTVKNYRFIDEDKSDYRFACAASVAEVGGRENFLL